MVPVENRVTLRQEIGDRFYGINKLINIFNKMCRNGGKRVSTFGYQCLLSFFFNGTSGTRSQQGKPRAFIDQGQKYNTSLNFKTIT